MKPRYLLCDYRTDLTQIVGYIKVVYLPALDRLMAQPSTEQRGRAVAELTNDLEMRVDWVRLTVLNIDLSTGKAKRTSNRAMRQHERTP